MKYGERTRACPLPSQPAPLLNFISFNFCYHFFYCASATLAAHRALSQRFGHPRVLGIPIPKSLAFWASPVGDAQNADRFDFA